MLVVHHGAAALNRSTSAAPSSSGRCCTHGCGCCSWLYCCLPALPRYGGPPSLAHSTGRLLILRTQEGSTPLHLGVVGHHVEVVQVLLDAGAAVYAVNKVNPAPPPLILLPPSPLLIITWRASL